MKIFYIYSTNIFNVFDNSYENILHKIIKQENVICTNNSGFTHVSTTYTQLFWMCTFSVDRKYLFDGAHHDPNYAPLPEDRPGGFEWGPGRPTGGVAAGGRTGREDNADGQQD